MMKIVKRVLAVILALIILLLLVVGGYVAYVFIAYHRIGDMALSPKNNNSQKVSGDEFTMISWNIGFCSYSQDFSFFMDGGVHSWAYSEEEVNKNLNGITAKLERENADFILLQEVDFDSTRSYHVNQREEILKKFPSYNSVNAQYYDSPFLFYPFNQPHGKSRTDLLMLSKYEMGASKRLELPVEEGFMKLLDLDRCYFKCEFELENGKKLVVYNAHLSAYTSDGKIADEQIKLLAADMRGEYEKGAYVICGGDMNKDLLGNSTEVFGCKGEGGTWALPFNTSLLGEELSLVSGYDEDNPVPSCRNCDTGYVEGETFVVTVDGFIVSDNVSVKSYEVLDEQFKNTDHNPVKVTFSLI